MTEPRSDDRSQARREAAILLGVDIEHLSAADSLRVDMVSALRLVIDSEQASILSGGSADLGKLNVAVQSLIALLPNRELPESAASRIDPRQVMLEMYMGMRRRGELAGDENSFDFQRRRRLELEAEVAALNGEIEQLKAQLAGSVPLPPSAVKLRNNNPSPPAAAPAAPPLPPAKPFVNGLSDIPQSVRDTRPPNEAWRNFVRIDWQG
jgi:hypothetical protein